MKNSHSNEIKFTKLKIKRIHFLHIHVEIDERGWIRPMVPMHKS